MLNICFIRNNSLALQLKYNKKNCTTKEKLKKTNTMKKIKEQTKTENELIELLILIELRQLNRQLKAEPKRI